MRFLLRLGCASLILLTAQTQAKITLPVDNSAAQYEIPRSQIKNYIQRGTIEENLKPIRQIKPQALGNEELLSIPTKYLPDDLRKKQIELKKTQESVKLTKPKKLGKVKSSDFVTVKKGSSGTKRLKLEETVWAAGKGGASKAILLPQRRLPKVEKIEEITLEAGKSIRVELEPGEPREITSLFKNGKTKDKDKQALLEAYTTYSEKDYASSTTFALGVLANKKTPNDTKVLAQYLLAHSLFQAGFYASSLKQLAPLVTSKLRRSVLGMAAKAIEQTRDDGAANQILSKVSLAQIPEKYRGTYAFHLGRVLLQTGAGKAALSAFQKVGDENPRNAEAQYFSGVIVASELDSRTPTNEWSREGSRAYQARTFFEEAHRRARVLNAKDLQALSNLSLGRLAYQLKQFNQAVFHYSEVPNTSPFAKEASFETAWALYRLGEFNRSLGRLHPMGSPYFEARDIPELWVLRSLNYLKLCRFDESNVSANTFGATTKSVGPSLKTAIQTLSKSKINKVSDFENLEIESWIKTALLQDPVVIKDKTRENLLANEATQLNILNENPVVRDKQLRQDTVDTLKGILERKRAAIGRAIKPYLVEKLNDVAQGYRSQLGKLDFLKFEIYSQATKFPDALKRPQAKRLLEEAEFLPGVFLKGNEILWRFSGEYWIDEVAGYDYFIPTECSLEKKL